MARPEGRSAPAKACQTRCAVYTRKSSEEGLEQDFNSLDAQREACEAYILSQRHEGWICLPAQYDDGGLSGGTMERPALRCLLTDIEQGRVDTVVVYKVDRLTRSLSDFAKTVDIFDRHGVSFVSVTQAFNTTSSMGRLTLNMLLSFAQFEREVTGERIRDKIAASKKKGMWMGGVPPLGYDVKDRKLIVNGPEAEIVRHIYRRYVALGSVQALQADLDVSGVVSKRRINRRGRETGGKPMGRGQLYHMLQNRIYRGEIVHKGESYPGEHDPIVDETVWTEAQQTLAGNRVARAHSTNAEHPSLLAGLVFDDQNQKLTPTHTNKKGRCYRYYVSASLLRSPDEVRSGWRLPAGDLERLVQDRLCAFLRDPALLDTAIEPMLPDAHDRTALATKASDLSVRWSSLPASGRRAMLRALLSRIDLDAEGLALHLLPERLNAILLHNKDTTTFPTPPAHAATITLHASARLKRSGLEMRLVIEGKDNDHRLHADRSLHRLLAQAHRYRALLLDQPDKSMHDLAADVGLSSSYFVRILRLSFLAPDMVKTILHDRHPTDVTAKRLSGDSRLTLAWADQRNKVLGFDPL